MSTKGRAGQGIVVATGVAVVTVLIVVGLVVAPAVARAGSPRIAAAGEHRLASHDGRTWVTGTYTTLPSGRLRVVVRSDAGRVRLTYRTARWRPRSRLVRVLNGMATATLPRGSRSLVARALRQGRLRASAAIRLRSNPLLQDADGNGTYDFQYDLDSDGRYEVVLFDDNRNGRYEAMYLDTSAGSGLFRDHNEDGYFEFLGMDFNKDGSIERAFYDGDRDGYAEVQYLDYIGPDGVADTWVATNVAAVNAQQTQSASDVAVQNIVTLNQLRQLNPWSTGYIPYNSTPSLLR